MGMHDQRTMLTVTLQTPSYLVFETGFLTDIELAVYARVLRLTAIQVVGVGVVVWVCCLFVCLFRCFKTGFLCVALAVL